MAGAAEVAAMVVAVAEEAATVEEEVVAAVVAEIVAADAAEIVEIAVVAIDLISLNNCSAMDQNKNPATSSPGFFVSCTCEATRQLFQNPRSTVPSRKPPLP